MFNYMIFRGTLRYASLNSHERRDLSRRDDIISWYYALIEYLTGLLPWREVIDRDVILRLKQNFGLERLAEGLPPAIGGIAESLALLQFADRPPYDASFFLSRKIFLAYFFT